MQWRVGWVAMLAWLWSGAAVAGDSETVLYKRALANLLRTTFEAKGTLETAAGKKAELRWRHSVRDGVRRTWIEVTAPADVKGQRWLLWDRDGGADKIWHFDSKAKRVAEVSATQWQAPFLNSNFALADFLYPDPEAYSFELGGEENVGGETFTVLRLAPKDKEKYRYAVRVYAVDPRANRLVRGLLFDAQGRAAARWIVERTEQRAGEWFPAKLRWLDLSSQKASVIELADIRYEPELPADAFEPSGLEERTTPTPDK